MERGGDVIPKITGLVTAAKHPKEIVFPANCPVCASALVREESEVDWRCVNASCPARLRAELLNFGRRGVMNIEGLGKAMVAQLLGQTMEDDEAAEDAEETAAPTAVREPIIRSIAGLYKLKKEQLTALERVGDKSAQALLDEIERSKSAPLSRVLLGARHPARWRAHRYDPGVALRWNRTADGRLGRRADRDQRDRPDGR